MSTISMYENNSKEVLFTLTNSAATGETISGYTILFQVGETINGPKLIEITGTTLVDNKSTIFIPIIDLDAGDYVYEVDLIKENVRRTILQDVFRVLPSFD